jgi:eukaryotic-like serine/threonine-protein kinase
MPDKAQDDDLVITLVELALALPPDERESYLRTACAGDSQLFSQVWNYVQAEQRMKGFLLDPLYPPALSEHPFEPGDLLDDRFRIVREVAQGGMGIVYEALDEKLERRIALKCAKAGFGKRLPPEVRHASEISHPNVCKIFEIHTASTGQGEVDFLTMEFLEGQTLSERLRGGPLPEAEARTIARQLCAGLAEAHRNQVIHGDLKSNNVILTTGADRALRAVITDFGLARRPEAAQRTAQSGTLGGTPDYMAPELWKGGKASIASDVYALGVILYELASGRLPYGPETPPEERATRKPPAANPKWDHILARCLDPDPAERFRDADAVAQAFAPPRSRRWFLGVAAALVLTIASGVATYQYATAPQESVRLAVLPFDSGGDTAPLAESLLSGASEQLARIKSSARTKLTVIPLSTALRNKVDTTGKARTALGATHALHGTLGNENGKVILQAYLTDARSLVNTREWKAEYAPGAVRYIPIALAGMVTGTLRLPALPSAAVVNAAAGRDYWAGLYWLRRNSGVDAALISLERAVAADPDSPLTYAGLAEAQWIKYALSKDRLWLDRATESVRQAESRNPDVAAVLCAAGLLKANAGWYDQAAADYRRAIELDPGNGSAYRRLGKAYEANNRLEEALMAYQKATEAQPDYFKPYQDLGAFYARRASYEEAIKAFKRMVDLEPDLSDAHFALASAYRDSGWFAEAEKELRISIQLDDTSKAEHALGYTLMHEARDREAISCYLRALALGPQIDLLWLNLGISYHRAGLRNEARDAFRRGLAVAEKELVRDPRNGLERSNLAYLLARLGDSQRARSEAAQALQLAPDDRDTRLMVAETYEALGWRDSTLALLSTWPGSLLSQLNRYPDVADLRRDSRFLKLLASHQIR